jgi:ADP-ribose pyrophosphatase YjhB (NUDIX family)
MNLETFPGPHMIEYTGFHYCPRCGAASVRAHRRNAVTCDQCGFVYFHNCAAAVAGIIETPGGIVLIRRGKEPGAGLFDLPGGFVDYGESLESALLREIREEVSAEARIASYFASYPNRYAYHGVVYLTTDAVFICEVAGIEEAFVPTDEVGQCQIVRPTEIDLGTIAFDSIRSALADYRARRQEV